MTLRTILVVVLAVVFGVAAAVYASTALNRTPETPRLETVPVVVAAVDVKAGTKLTRPVLRLRDVPRDGLPAGALQRLEDAVDRAAEVPLFKDELVLEAKLTKGIGAGLAVHVPKGMRAKAITMVGPAASVAGGIRPRDHVDVKCIAEHLPNDEHGGVITVLQNVEVARVDNRMETATSEDGKVTEQREVRTVTLLVQPVQADHLELAEKLGKLSLHLRNGADDESLTTPPVTLDSIPSFPVKAKPAGDKKVVPASAPEPEPAPPLRIFRSTSEGSAKPL